MARLLQLFVAQQADFFQDEAFPDKTPTTGHFGVVFPSTGSPLVAFGGRMPEIYNNSDITVVIHWASLTVTTGGVVWDVAFERLAEDGQSLTVAGFAANQSVTTSPSGTSDALDYASISFTNSQADSVVLGEGFRLRITRNTGDPGDDMIGDAFLRNVGVLEV